jgi:ComF family protein
VVPIAEPLCDTGGSIVRAQAIGAYQGALREIIHALKYDGRRSLARPLGALMRERGADVLTGALCAVPVPLHPSRKRSRGFNQAGDLACRIGLPVCGALERLRPTEAQAGLPAEQRRRNVEDAFGLARAGRGLSGATVVLIDDVSTTGATLEACARVLKEAGVREVRALTAARVVPPGR